MKLSLNIRAKLILITLSIISLSMSVTMFLNIKEFTRVYKEGVFKSVFTQAKQLKILIEGVTELGLNLDELEGINKECQEKVAEIPYARYCLITDIEGKAIYHSNHKRIGTIYPTPLIPKATDSLMQLNTLEYEQPIYEFYLPLEGVANQPIGFIKLGVMAEVIDAQIFRLTRYAVIISIFFILIAAILILLLSNISILKPINILMAGITDFGKGNLSNRLKINSGDEIGKLAKTFNKMADELQKSTVSIEVLKESQRRFQNVTETTGDWIWEMDAQGIYTYSNSVVTQILEYEPQEISGKYFYDFFDPATKETSKQKIGSFIEKKQVFKDIAICHLRKDGEQVILEISGIPIFTKEGALLGIQGTSCNVTQKRKMEEDVFKVQKLESIGVLAGGIAHDFNNILTAILGNISLVKLHLKKDSDMCEMLDEAEEASLQAKNLTQQLLTFSKGGSPVKETASIVDLLKGTSHFALHGSRINYDFDFAPNIWPVNVDTGQISQVVQNLIINANNAMPNGGTIHIKAENIYLPPDNTWGNPNNKYVKISVTDQGIGISPEHIHKIFDPYFTTKQTGSGLGLAVTYSVIKKHNGHIEVQSTLGKGTTFYIYLPTSDETIVEEAKPITHASESITAKILIMDDEEMVLTALKNMIISLGCEVTTTSNGQEAIKEFTKAKKNNVDFNLVILNLTIAGGMGGEDTIKELLKIDPNTKALVSSGYCNNPILSNFKEYGFCGIVTKPCNIKELSALIRKFT